jgi:type III restriction enzyme
MLTEGWNTKTVTHLLGFRKFGSSLLCEQVAGRTLRRVTRTKEDDEIRFEPEYAQILGIPFPQYGEPDADPDTNEKKKFPPVTVEPEPNRRHLRVEWPNVVQLRRTGGNRPVEVLTKPEGPDESHEVPAHISERINVEPTAGLTSRFQGDPPVTAKRFSYLAASTVVKRIEQEVEEQARGGDDDAPVIRLARLFSQTVNAVEEYRQKAYLTGPENQDRWPSDEMAVLSASEWLHRNIQVIKPDRSGVQMEAEGSAIAPWLHTGLLRPYDIGNNPERVYGPTKKSEITYADCDSSWEVALAQHLDEMPEITRWARNKGLNWSIPYVVDRQQKRYWPDFVAVASLSEGLELNIVIETKGLVREYDPIKRRWAQEYWVPAVNRHPEYGVAAGKLWTYLYLDSEALVVQAQERIRVLIENARKG